ncbi:MAG: hypothetical protein ACWA41_07365 [Putridiphycobacter sp.]
MFIFGQTKIFVSLTLLILLNIFVAKPTYQFISQFNEDDLELFEDAGEEENQEEEMGSDVLEFTLDHCFNFVYFNINFKLDMNNINTLIKSNLHTDILVPPPELI